MTAPAPEQTISVIMPAYNAAHYLPLVLPPLLEALEAGLVTEVLVVDDRSTDDTSEKARAMGATVLVTDENGGPGKARNLAAEVAKGDILWLVDSDVIAWPEDPHLIRAAFTDPAVHAVFGSYDNTPAGQSLVSRYKNLTHRFHHQESDRDATTFWAGCGAIRRDVYLKLGGFDVETYRVPSIEDIEFGYRISDAGGRIRVIPDLLGKHLKVWTLRGAIHTDIFRRALPWSRLMISRGGIDNNLNTGIAERLRAGLAGLLFLALLGWLLGISGIFPALIFLAAAFGINWTYFKFLQRNGGTGFAIISLLLHQLYYVYSSAAFVWCLFEYHVLGVRDRLHVP